MLDRIVAAITTAALLAVATLPASAQTPDPNRTATPAAAQAARDRALGKGPISATSVGETELINRANAWTIGLAAGLPEGTFLPFAAEIARNLNDGIEMRVLGLEGWELKYRGSA